MFFEEFVIESYALYFITNLKYAACWLKNIYYLILLYHFY